MSLRSWTTCHLCKMVKLAKSLSCQLFKILHFCNPFVCFSEAKLVRYRHLILNLVICVFYLYLVHQKDLSFCQHGRPPRWVPPKTCLEYLRITKKYCDSSNRALTYFISEFAAVKCLFYYERTQN